MSASAFSRRTTVAVATLSAAVAAVPAARAAGTTPVTTFNFAMSAFVESPATNTIYAAVPALNEVVSINAATLAVTGTTVVGSDPTGLCLSPDGSTLYTANNGSNFLGVVSTATMAAGTPIFLGTGNAPIDVQDGTNGRLWVLTNNGISQINAAGTSTGANLGTAAGLFPLLLSGGEIRTSNDHATLYYAGYGGSPSYLYKYDVGGAAGVETLVIASGSNGEDLELSHNNATVVDAQGSGNNTRIYSDDVYRTSDLATIQTLPVGAYPQSFAFSPDDVVGYAGANFQSPNIQVYSLTTGLQTGSITASGTPQKLFVEDAGRYLFADTGSTTQVFATGRVVVPEPAGAGLAAAAAAGVLSRRRRGSAFGR